MEFRHGNKVRNGYGKRVSILVFLDMEFRPPDVKIDVSTPNGFQSLFFWIWNSDLSGSMP